jgi:hypothetical protein
LLEGADFFQDVAALIEAQLKIRMHSPRILPADACIAPMPLGRRSIGLSADDDDRRAARRICRDHARGRDRMINREAGHKSSRNDLS